MMHTMDNRQQAFNSQRREQRHNDQGSTNTYVPTAAGNFLSPDAPGHFTYSAEPASMIEFGGSNATTGDVAFTPNTASSFDSSQYADTLNLSYPPANTTYMNSSNYSLSPASHSRNGFSISPSHSVDHLSPEAGYMSDPNTTPYYSAPQFNGQLHEDFSNLNFGDPVAPQAFPPFQTNEVDLSTLTSQTVASYTTQPQNTASNARLDSHSQLLSPCPTNNSSPNVADFSNAQYNGVEYHTSTPPSHATPQQHSTPIKQQQQHSPALTNSPNNMPLANPQPLARHLTSPIVRVEIHGGRDSPSHSDVSRPMSKRSYGSRRSGNHLSPFPNDESSDDGDDDDMQQQVRIRAPVRSADRNEDGSWRASPTSGQAGLTPEDRQEMGDVWVPSIEEIAQQRLQEEKKSDVHDWLSRSEVGSEVGAAVPSPNLLIPFGGRRRAKSTNDAHGRQYGPGFGLGVRTNFDHIDDSNIPGPGLYIDERSEFDEESDDDDEPVPESPPAEVNIVASENDTDVSFFPTMPEGGIFGAIVRPWIDGPSQPPTSSTRYQPPTSNAAMSRFYRRAKDVESASLAATVGSRRLSESDLGSIRAAPGVIKAIEPDLKKQKDRGDRQRRPSFLDNLRGKRAPSNILKRKNSIPPPPQPPSQENIVVEKPKEPLLQKPARIGSWGRPKSPRLDTSVANHGQVGPPSSTGLSTNSGTWYQGAKKAIRRSRSRSDIGKSPGLAELMTQHGGPPMPMLASPLADTEATKQSAQPSPAGDDDEDDMQDAIIMNLEVRSDPIIPTYEGFKTHARQLNPRLTDYMVERITQEQIRRYKRLLEFKVKHLNAVKNGNCSSAKFCTDLGGESKQLTPKAGNKEGEAPFLGFQVTAPGSSDDDGENVAEGTLAAAGFPSGVPLPPVKRLPAEFECPLCFKVKKFYKPSDWTKHVHEDVQPFTCTFPNCGEPKSFKRKADWVRHENERHRQLEYWTCQMADCNHTCYRKDNFVQHLVREHKIAEPRQRTVKGGNKDAPGNTDPDDIWGLVARCRRDTPKQPKDEPCRFCGNICTSWKKLTVHLAKHMEQISMPILPLVDQKQISADTIISPVVEMPETRKLSATPNRSPIDNPSRYNPKSISTLAPGIDPSFAQYPSDSPGAVSTAGMHTYPPPQMMAYKNAQPPMSNGAFTGYAMDNPQSYSGRTYPGLQDLQDAAKAGSWPNNLQIPAQPYLNGNTGNAANGVVRYPITPVSAVGPQPAVFNASPSDPTPYSTDTMGTTYFTQEPQSMGANGLNDMGGFDASNAMQFPQNGAYQDMYMATTQRNYHYQGQ